MSLFDTLAQVVAMLDAAGIPHMIAGSLASTYHSEPRTTQDIDIVIDPTREALTAFVASVDRERFYIGDAEAAFTRRGQFNLIDLDTGWKVDLIVRRDRAFSHSEFERRIRAELSGLAVRVATPEDTILAKLEWGAISESDRQLRDVRAIVRAVGSDLDLDYLRHWARELGLGERLEEALSQPERG